MVGDEVAPGPADALEAAHRANGEAAEDLDDEIVGEAASPGSAHRGDSPSGEAAENVSQRGRTTREPRLRRRVGGAAT
jgi:hypothetical protein